MNTSLPKRALLHNIIKDLFQNQSVKSDTIKEYYVFSELYLSKKQKKMLDYPDGFVPLDIFVLQQVDTHTGNKFTTSLSMVSFVKNDSEYIYGYYFNITDQPHFRIKKLVKSKCAIKLDSCAKFVTANYEEVYNDVMCNTMILGLGSQLSDEKPEPYSTL